MWKRILGMLGVLLGGAIIFADFIYIWDPPPGYRSNVVPEYAPLAIGIVLLGLGLYSLIAGRSRRTTP